MPTATATINSHLDVLRCRQTLWKNGFHPIPVRTGDKRPTEARWTTREGTNPPPCVAPDAVVKPDAASTGILCDGLRAIDADIDNAEIAEEAWRLATEMLGEAPVRFRSNSDRFLLVYRATEGEPRKCALKGTLGAVEVLGRGNQFVAFGRHPSGAAYDWSTGSPETQRRDELPAVTEDQILAFLVACAPLIDARPPEVAASPPFAIGAMATLPSAETTAWGRAALNAECDRVAMALPGAQSDTLASAAFKIGQRIASGEIARDEAETALLAAGMQMVNGDDKRRWTQRDVTGVISRQTKAGLGSPAGPDRVEQRVIVDPEASFSQRESVSGSLQEPVSAATKTPIVPVPADAPVMAFKHPVWGAPHRTWAYRDVADRLVGYVARWVVSDVEPEHVAHVTCCDLGPGKRAAWRMKPMPIPRPLFDLPTILARPQAPVLICPDEWSVEAAAILLPDMVATTTAHDPKSPAWTDFTPLADRAVILVPPVGRANRAWADMVAAQASKAGASYVKVLNLTRIAANLGDEMPPPDDGWDIIGAVSSGLTAETLATLINTDPELISFHVDERQKRAAETLAQVDTVPTREEMPPLFQSSDSGVFRLVERQEAGETIREYVQFCSPLTVVAETRDADGRNWGRLLRVVDRDAASREWSMPMELLAGDGVNYRSELLSMGLTIAPGKKPRDYLHEFISYARPTEKARCVPRTGWHGRTYVGIDGAIRSGAASERLLLQAAVPPDHPFRVSGTLSDWQQNVARYAVGNSRLGLAISAAFAAPLLYSLDAEGGGFHLRGGSSTGKSTALAVGGSVWGGGGLNGFLRTWRATSNGLEGVAALHCDALLCLDEMGQVDGREAGSIAYMLANGSGKSRAGRTGEARSAAGWRVLFLSSGEVGLADKLAEDGRGKRAAAGQEVRIVDIPADAGEGFGLFEHLHEFGSADALARHLKGAAARHYGNASRAFLTRVVEHFDDAQLLRSVRHRALPKRRRWSDQPGRRPVRLVGRCRRARARSWHSSVAGRRGHASSRALLQ